MNEEKLYELEIEVFKFKGAKIDHHAKSLSSDLKAGGFLQPVLVYYPDSINLALFARPSQFEALGKIVAAELKKDDTLFLTACYIDHRIPFIGHTAEEITSHLRNCLLPAEPPPLDESGEDRIGEKCLCNTDLDPEARKIFADALSRLAPPELNELDRMDRGHLQIVKVS